MGRYTAQEQSLSTVGGPQAPRYRVDVPGAIDAFANGASSLIHAAYTRHMGQQEMQLRQDQLARQESHDQRTEARADQEFAWKRDNAAAELAQRETENRRRFQENGGTPGSEGGATVSIAPDAAPAAAPSSIQSAMTAGFSKTAQPESPLYQPAPVQALPKVQYGEEAATPDQYDPTKAAAYVRSTETAKIAAEERLKASAARDATTLAARKTMGDYSVQVAKIRAAASSKGLVNKAMTGNALESYYEKVVAPGLLAQHNGDIGEAVNSLANTPEGKKLADAGFTPNHLYAAQQRDVNGRTKAALSLQTGAAGADPGEAVDAVNKTRDLVSGGKTTTTTTAPAPTVAAPAATAAPKKIVAPAVDESKMSDADLWEAKVKGGMKKDAATAYVTNRKKK